MIAATLSTREPVTHYPTATDPAGLPATGLHIIGELGDAPPVYHGRRLLGRLVAAPRISVNAIYEDGDAPVALLHDETILDLVLVLGDVEPASST